MYIYICIHTYILHTYPIISPFKLSDFFAQSPVNQAEDMVIAMEGELQVGPLKRLERSTGDRNEKSPQNGGFNVKIQGKIMEHMYNV